MMPITVREPRMLSIGKRLILLLLSATILSAFGKQPHSFVDYPLVSRQLVEMARNNRQQEFDSLEQLLNQASFDILKNQLYSDTRKKTFWLNVHNAFSINLLRKDPDLLKNHAQFLATKQIPVAGTSFSFNEIEHGILRRSNYRNSETDAIKQLRVLEADYRVHFGMNFGAKDCPAIVFFEEHKLGDQLRLLEKQFITEHTTIDSVKKEVQTSELFEWYRDDFGGKDGLRTLFLKNGVEQAKEWKISYNAFNWDILIN